MQQEEKAEAEATVSKLEHQTDDADRASLHSAFPKHVGYVSLLMSLANVGLQIYSHLSTSAVFLSSIPYNQQREAEPALGTPPDAGGGGNTTTDGTCLTDGGGFEQWWESRGADEFFQYAESCGPRVLISDEEYFDCLRNDYGYNATNDVCLRCFLLPVECVLASCLGACLAAGVESEGCVGCLIENDCDGPFEECAGVSVGLDEWEAPPDSDANRAARDSDYDQEQEQERRAAARSLQEGEEATTTQLYEVYSISFVDSIRDAANGGAWWLVIFLVCLSGIWPYLKNVIMLIAWFVPMTATRRSSILQWLTRLAKWSLVDVFVIVIICTGVKIDMQIAGGIRFVLVGEPRVGIITFCLAALWDLSQGEWMRTKHFQMMQQEEGKEDLVREKEQQQSSPASASLSAPALETKSSLLGQVKYRDGTRGCSSAGRAVYTFIVIAQIALIGAVIGTLCVTFSISGFPEKSVGQNRYEYTAVSVATALLTDFGTISPGGNTAFVGSIFMVVVYLAVCIVLPLMCCLLMAAGALLPGGIINKNPRQLHRYFTLVSTLGGFSCLDVWLLAFGLCAIEFNSLVESALNQIAGNMCQETGTCISLFSTIEMGVFLAIPAVVLGWIVEANFTYMEAFFVHPSEMFAPWNWLFGARSWTVLCDNIDEEPTERLKEASGSA